MEENAHMSDLSVWARKKMFYVENISHHACVFGPMWALRHMFYGENISHHACVFVQMWALRQMFYGENISHPEISCENV